MIIGLDVGDKRVGVAVADLETRVARPLTTLSNNRRLIGELCQLQRELGFSTVVIGIPLTLSGHEGSQAKKTMELADKIKNHLSVDVVFEDERMTSRDAEGRLKDVTYARSDIDAVSASLILESWLARGPKG